MYILALFPNKNYSLKHLNSILPNKVTEQDILFRPYRNVLVIKATNYNSSVIRLIEHRNSKHGVPNTTVHNSIPELARFMLYNINTINEFRPINISKNKRLMRLLTSDPKIALILLTHPALYGNTLNPYLSSVVETVCKSPECALALAKSISIYNKPTMSMINSINSKQDTKDEYERFLQQ